MRGRAVAAAVALAGTVTVLCAPAVVARECDNEWMPFSVEVARGFGQVRAGEEFPIAYEPEVANPGVVRDLVVTIGERSWEFGSGSPSRDLVVSAPSGLGRFTIWISWRQTTADGQPLCDGEAGWDAVAVPPGSTFGDPRDRLDGRWKITATPRNFRSDTLRFAWRLSPTCDVGGCVTRVSGPGQRYRMEPDAFGYAIEHRYRTWCYGRGDRRVRGGNTVTIRYRLRVERGAYVDRTLVYRGTRIGGTISAADEIGPRGRAAGCTRGRTLVWTLRGVRQG